VTSAFGKDLVGAIMARDAEREHFAGLAKAMACLKLRPDQAFAIETLSGAGRNVNGRLNDRRNHVLGIIAFAATLVATVFGFTVARRFVRERLQFVDAAQTWKAPLAAGLGAWALATIVVWLLPLLGGGTALLFGISVALGTRAGARDIRVGRSLNPGQI